MPLIFHCARNILLNDPHETFQDFNALLIGAGLYVFAARPSGTENIYKLYAESLKMPSISPPS